MMINRLLTAGLAVLLLSACERRTDDVASRNETQPNVRGPQFGSFGVSTEHIDAAIDPGADFYRYVNGQWLDSFQIPERYSSYGSFTMVAEAAETKMLAAIEQTAAADPAPGSIERKVVDFFASHADQSAIDARGLVALSADFARVDAIASLDDLGRAFGDPSLLAASPFILTIGIDEKRPGQYAIYLSQGGLGLPNRDLYLLERHAELQARYRAHIANLLALGGVVDAEAKADRVYELERELAAAHWDPQKSRQRELTYNPKTVDQLKAFAPDAPWDAILLSAGLQAATEVVLSEDDALRGLAAITTLASVDTWKDYLKFHVIRRMADVLPSPIQNAGAEFRTRALGLPPETPDRRRKALAALDEALGDAAGKLYVDRHFSRGAREQATGIAKSVVATFIERINQSSWMSDAARKGAASKLEALSFKIGYSDKRRDYAGLSVAAGDAYGNLKRAAAFAWASQVARLGGAVDRSTWSVSPQSVDARYDPTANEVVVTAAFLQPPIFDPNADAAVNYGAIGALIAHEVTHAIDDQGRKTDADGLLRDWWTAGDRQEFQRRAVRIGVQYGGYEPLPGVTVNPTLTMGENIGDVVGLAVAHEAYRKAVGGADGAALDGFTGDQRFFLGWAQLWRRAVRDEQLREQLAVDAHAPAQFRVNGAVRNLDAWRGAFDISPNDPLYLAPGDQVTIW